MGESRNSASTRNFSKHVNAAVPNDSGDRLTVLHAAPLGYVYNEEFFPLEQLDFEAERDALKESIKEAGKIMDRKIDLDFRIGTTNQLAALMARGNSTILHISCHGSSSYLAFDNGWGVVHPLRVQDLRNLSLSVGTDRLPQLVFISACDSRSVGKAFVDAGVPHVICCQKADPQLHHSWAVEFARHFYHGLVCGMTLMQAFEHGHVAVDMSPYASDGHRKATRLLMLPEDEDHNVCIFSTAPTRQEGRRTRAPQPSHLLQRTPFCAPHVLLGRQREMHQVMNALRDKHVRLVRVSGPSGIGKSSLVRNVSTYLHERYHLHFQEGPVWLPDDYEQENDKLARCFSQIFKVFKEPQTSSTPCDDDYNSSCQTVLSHFHRKKSLAIIDARRLKNLKRLRNFLERLFKETTSLKVIVIHREEETNSFCNISCGEVNINVTPFDFETTAKLFSKLCPHVKDRRCEGVNTPHDLVKRLVTRGAEDASMTKMSEWHSIVFAQLGMGNPAHIHQAAKNMPLNDFEMLCVYPASRAALDKRLAELDDTVSIATQNRDYHEALRIKQQAKEMARLRESFQEIETLRELEKDVLSDQERAIRLNKLDKAAALDTTLKSLRAQIEVETHAMDDKNPNPSPKQTGNYDEASNRLNVSPTTRASLQSEICYLESMMREAGNRNDFKKAHKIDQKRLRLIKRKESLPTVSTLSSKIRSLESKLDEARLSQNWLACIDLQHKIDVLAKELKLEKDAEVAFGEAQQTTNLETEDFKSTDNDDNDYNTLDERVLNCEQPNQASNIESVGLNTATASTLSGEESTTFEFTVDERSFPPRGTDVPLPQPGAESISGIARNEFQRRDQSSAYIQGNGNADESIDAMRVQDATLACYWSEPVVATLIPENDLLDPQSQEAPSTSYRRQRRNRKWRFSKNHKRFT